MKAVQIEKYGGVDVLEVNDVFKPQASEGQVLVEVYACGLNPFDWKVREGYAKEYIKLQFPATLGSDFAGVAIKGGSGFKVGDRVFGQGAVYGGGSGAFSEFVAASGDKIAKKPEKIDFAEAAALPLVGESAIQALEEHIQLKAGQKILIHGGAGGIGHIAIQLAKVLGAYVATTVVAGDTIFAKSLGVDEVTNYEKEKFDEKLKDFDAVLDTVGGEITDRSFKVLKKGGILVSMLGAPSEDVAKKYGVVVVGQNTQGNTKKLDRLSEFVESGKIKVNVDRVFPLDKTREAFKHLEQGKVRGKAVIKIKDQ